uniref:ABC transporter G family member STR2 n=1 Tax=Ananas comosus var. bracteatus TaxID=296719 RepID=A0A6V7NQL4_ANACO|nr:unnamed protein product [Ananas comosus var. bracteatus]
MAHKHEGTGRRETVIDIGGIKPPSSFTGGLEFSGLTYTVTKKQKAADGEWASQEVDLLHRITGYAPKRCVTAVMGPSGAGKSTFLDGLAGRIASGSLRGKVSLDGTEMSPAVVKRTSAYIMQDDRLFPMLTVYETLMFAADFRLSSISYADKKEKVEKLIEQLGLTSSRNTYIGDEGTRGLSGGERRRVSIGVDIIHGPALLFLDEPTSGLDSTSAHSVIERVHHIARSGSTVILTIHQPSYRIQMLLDHLIILARGQLMFIGPPKDVGPHLGRMGCKVPKGENSIEYLLDVIQEYDQSDIGVAALADFCLTGLKPPRLSAESGGPYSVASSVPPTPADDSAAGRRRSLQHSHAGGAAADEFDHSLRSPWGSSKSPWSGSRSGVIESLRFTPSRQRRDQQRRPQNPPSLSPGYYTYSHEILSSTPTPHSSDYTVNEDDYQSPNVRGGRAGRAQYSRAIMGPKFANSYGGEVWGITNRLSFFIFTVCLFFFSSNDAVPAFIQERFIFIRETSHNAYRASSYTAAGLVTYLPFLLLQAATYAGIVWFALGLRGSFLYFLVMLYMSLLSTNSFVVFVSSVVPNFILGYAAVIAFTALFFLFCGYFLSSHSIPRGWKWMNAVSTMKYPYEGLLMNEFQTNRTFAHDLIGRAVTGEDILRQMSISLNESDKWKMVLYLLGWAVFYRILFYLVLRFASNNQRK